MGDFSIRPLNDADRAWVADFITRRWGAEIAVAHGVVYRPHKLPGFVALCSDEMTGLVTYHIEGDACEIVTLDSTRPGIGIGTALINVMKEHARQSSCTRLWLITANLVQSRLFDLPFA